MHCVLILTEHLSPDASRAVQANDFAIYTMVLSQKMLEFAMGLHDHLCFGRVEASGLSLSMRQVPSRGNSEVLLSLPVQLFFFHQKEESLKTSTAYGQKIFQINCPPLICYFNHSYTY